MFCGKCGMNNNQGTNFCISCGAKLNNQQNNNQIVQPNINYTNSNANNGYQQANTNYQQSQYQNNTYADNNMNQNKQIKTYWWLPLVLFFGGVGCSIIRFVLNLLSLNENGEVATEGIIPFINSILGILYILALLLVFPSIIFVIVRYTIKKNR